MPEILTRADPVPEGFTRVESPHDGSTRIVVLSCKWAPYRLCWPAWAAAYIRHWQRPWGAQTYMAGCAWPVSAVFCEDRAQPWGDFVAEALGQFTEPVVLVFMDDMVLTADVDLPELMRCRTEMDAEHASYYRVVPTPECSRPFAHGKGGVHDPRDGMYAASLQVSFWAREYLIAQARGVRTPWDFELSRPVAPAGIHLSVTRENRPLSMAEMLTKGQWTDDGKRIMEAGGWPMAE